jgi:hypothetical protein
MVSVKAAPPLVAIPGDMPLKTGAGFDGAVTTRVADAVAVV